MMKAPIPFLWFEKDAEEAANFYVSLLPNSRAAEAMMMHMVKLDVAALQRAFDGEKAAAA